MRDGEQITGAALITSGRAKANSYHYCPVMEKAKGRMMPVVIDDLRCPDLLTI